MTTSKLSKFLHDDKIFAFALYVKGGEKMDEKMGNVILMELREFKTEMKEFREENNKKWEANERRWEVNEKRWEENERRWEANEKRWEENERRWEANEKRWEENERRWLANEKRWEINDRKLGEINKRLDLTNKKLEQTNVRLDQTNETLEQTNTRVTNLEEGRVKDRKDILVVLETMQKSIQDQFSEMKEYMDTKFEKIFTLQNFNDLEHQEFRKLLFKQEKRSNFHNSRLNYLEEWKGKLDIGECTMV